MSVESVDPDTDLRVLVKQPGESRQYRINLAPLLGEATITTVSGVTAVSQGKVGGSSTITPTGMDSSGPEVLFRLAGGTHNENYKITAKVVDSGGNTLEAEGMLYVREL